MLIVQGLGRKRLKVLVSYLSKTNFLLQTKINNQLFGIRNNRGPKSICTKNYESYHIFFRNQETLLGFFILLVLTKHQFSLIFYVLTLFFSKIVRRFFTWTEELQYSKIKVTNKFLCKTK